MSLFPIAAFMDGLRRKPICLDLAHGSSSPAMTFGSSAASILLISDWVFPTLLGHAFVIAQAIAVVLLAELEYAGLRRSLA